mmetsp:Transcript_13986/g.35115  ORF Transcript_13986/g.35115 Transcript_13986/m.35115 type:complete len:238 (+) Transcript_13986:70-783(+)
MGLQATLSPCSESHGGLGLPHVSAEFGSLVVKNTFLEAERVRTESLECFFRERRIYSCPLTAVCEDDPAMAAAAEPFASALEEPLTSTLAQPEEEAELVDLLRLGSQQLHLTPRPISSLPPPPSTPAPSATALVSMAEQVLARSDASNVMTSVGSLKHGSGTCKPCAFFHKTGCANGPACPFCHLCEDGALKRRKQEKRQRMSARLRSKQEAQQAAVAAAIADEMLIRSNAPCGMVL